MYNIKKTFIYITTFCLILSTSCYKQSFQEINTSPTDLTTVDKHTLLSSIELANNLVQLGHLQRISGMWSGQYRGEILLYQSLYEYNITSEESKNFFNNLYNGVLEQTRQIQATLTTPNDYIYQAISRIIEANAIGTATAIMGNIPYTEAATGINTPKFDRQAEIFEKLQLVLDTAINFLYLNSLNSKINTLPNTIDLYFSGDTTKWKKVAFSLKARYYLLTKEYQKCLDNAKMGIDIDAATLYFTPKSSAAGQNNTLFSFMSDRAGYMSSRLTYLDTLLSSGFAFTRNNTKTNESARRKYFSLENNKINAATNKMPIISALENKLMIAEADARVTGDITNGLVALNQARALIPTLFTKVASTDIALYTAYESDNFNIDSIKNKDNKLTPVRAFLKEVIEERYVSLYGTFMPFLDANRVRKETDIAVPFWLNTPTAKTFPYCFLLAQTEINSNPNAPINNNDIYAPTPINQ